MIFNLFIAILLDSFASEEGEEGEGGAEAPEPGRMITTRRTRLTQSSCQPGCRRQDALELLAVEAILQVVGESRSGESFIITAILISSITLAIDEPRLDQERHSVKEALTVSNYFFTALFTLELLAKVFAYDLLAPPDENGENGGYLLSTWNLLVSHAAATQSCTKSYSLASPVANTVCSNPLSCGQDLFIVTVSLVSLCPRDEPPNRSTIAARLTAFAAAISY